LRADLEQLAEWMGADREDEHLEFKEAKSRYSFDELAKYCCGLANEGGGVMVLGVTDKKPRRVVGTQAFRDLQDTRMRLNDHFRIRIDADEVHHPDGRVVVFRVPGRPVGTPIAYQGVFWQRIGGSLRAMTPEVLRRIFDETIPDFSAQVCPGADLASLNPEAIGRLRAMWRLKSGNDALDSLGDEQLLADAELSLDGGVTYAALILLGRERALGKHLGQAEVVFEYRSSDTSIPYQDRREYREGFFLYDDDLWTTINLRNEIQQYQEGLFRWNIPTFGEAVIREGILNAISHREYRLPGSVFVREYPRKVEIESPGGFPPGITPDNILSRQYPRNRRIAEVLAKCGLVERSGQGMDRMFADSISESKLPPDFAGSDEFRVVVTLHGQVRDPLFLRFLEEVGAERRSQFGAEDLLVLDLVHREAPIPEHLRPRLARLVDLGVLQVKGRGRGTTYLLSRRFYTIAGRRGVYTRRRGLDRETNKALLLRHIEDNRAEGTRLRELSDVLPALSRRQVQTLLHELRTEGRIHVVGRTRAARWYPGPG